DKFVANAAAAKDFFESARLEVGAVFHGAGLRRVVVEELSQFFGDKFGFGLGVAGFEVAKIGAAGYFGTKSFAEALGIIFDDSPGGIEDALRGAVVALEANDFGVREVGRTAGNEGEL